MQIDEFEYYMMFTRKKKKTSNMISSSPTMVNLDLDKSMNIHEYVIMHHFSKLIMAHHDKT